MWVKTTLCFVFFIGLIQTAQGQNNVQGDPGYVDLTDIEKWFDTEAQVEVNIQGALLKLVAVASEPEDPEFSDLLRKLKGIYVRSFSLSPSQLDRIDRQTTNLRKRLETQGWETIARVRDDEERVDLYVRTIDDVIAGLVVIAIAPGDDETVFINIVGDIDPEEIGRIGSKFNIDRLDERTGRHASRY